MYTTSVEAKTHFSGYFSNNEINEMLGNHKFFVILKKVQNKLKIIKGKEETRINIMTMKTYLKKKVGLVGHMRKIQIMIKNKRPKKNKTEKNPGVKELTSKKEVH